MANSDSTVKSIFIGAIGSLIIFAVTTFYTDFLKQPIIHINLIKNDHGNTLKINNIGGKTANNLKITVGSSPKIEISAPAFYTEDVTNVTTKSIATTAPKNATGVIQSEKGWWVMNIKRLSPFSELEVDAKHIQNARSTLEVFVTYDEGSQYAMFLLSGENDFELKDKRSSLDLTIPVVSIIVAGVVYLIARVYLRTKKKTVIRFGRLLRKMAHDMVIVILFVDGHPDHNLTLSGKLFSVRFWNSEIEDARRNLINNNDTQYNLLEDFFDIIERRDRGIKNNQFTPDQLKSWNNDLVGTIKKFFCNYDISIEKRSALLPIGGTVESVKVSAKEGANLVTIMTLEEKNNEPEIPSSFRAKLNGKEQEGLNDDPNKIYDKIFENLRKSLFTMILGNIGRKGWTMLLLIFILMISVIVIIETRPFSGLF